MINIAAILLKHWDPIDVSDVIWANDEYNAVAERLLVLLKNGASHQEIIEQLIRYETDHLGLTPQPDRALAVAKLLVSDE